MKTKVKLSTLIYIVIIAILLILLVFSYFYVRNIKKEASTSEEKYYQTYEPQTDSKKYINEIEENIMENNITSEENNIEEDEQYSNEINEFVTLNGKQHEIKVCFKEGEEIYPEDFLCRGTMKILFDSNTVRYINIFKYKNQAFGENDVEFKTITGYDDKNYLILETNFPANQTQTETVVYVINEEGEITSTILISRGTGVTIDGDFKGDVYIEDNSIEWYAYEPYNDGDVAVVKYRANIFHDGLINIKIMNTYSIDEVELSGKT